MTRSRALGAIALGCFLATAPFLRYRFAAPHPTAHFDHAARHGGVLGMVGDVHIEVVRRAGRIEVYPSDAYRRPLRASGGRVEFDDGTSAALTWAGARLVAPDDPAARTVTCTVFLDDGRAPRMSVDF
jgi:hypothetical protein